MSDHRAAQRHRTLLPAHIEIYEDAGVNCLIRDLSDSGARVQVSEGVVLPGRFRLFVPKLERWRHVLLKWRRGDMIGLEFDDEIPGSAVQVREIGDVHVLRLEAEIARLRSLITAIRADPSKARLLLETD